MPAAVVEPHGLLPIRESSACLLKSFEAVKCVVIILQITMMMKKSRIIFFHFRLPAVLPVLLPAKVKRRKTNQVYSSSRNRRREEVKTTFQPLFPHQACNVAKNNSLPTPDLIVHYSVRYGAAGHIELFLLAYLRFDSPLSFEPKTSVFSKYDWWEFG